MRQWARSLVRTRTLRQELTRKPAEPEIRGSNPRGPATFHEWQYLSPFATHSTSNHYWAKIVILFLSRENSLIPIFAKQQMLGPRCPESGQAYFRFNNIKLEICRRFGAHTHFRSPRQATTRRRRQNEPESFQFESKIGVSSFEDFKIVVGRSSSNLV